jgi:hypothetical protein
MRRKRQQGDDSNHDGSRRSDAHDRCGSDRRGWGWKREDGV